MRQGSAGTPLPSPAILPGIRSVSRGDARRHGVGLPGRSQPDQPAAPQRVEMRTIGSREFRPTTVADARLTAVW